MELLTIRTLCCKFTISTVSKVIFWQRLLSQPPMMTGQIVPIRPLLYQAIQPPFSLSTTLLISAQDDKGGVIRDGSFSTRAAFAGTRTALRALNSIQRSDGRSQLSRPLL